MTAFRFAVLTAMFAAVLPVPAMAGPINWSYASTGARDGEYWIDPAGYPSATLAGQNEDIYLIGGWRYLLFTTPIPPQGPVMWTSVTITDADSGQSGTFGVPIEFFDIDPATEDGWYKYEPRIVPIAPVNLVLGEHRYAITNSHDHALSVRVTATPEPATLAMAGGGLVIVGLARLRRRQ